MVYRFTGTIKHEQKHGAIYLCRRRGGGGGVGGDGGLCCVTPFHKMPLDMPKNM